MQYRIKSIKHTGTKGLEGTERLDGRYPLRIGRIVNLNLEYIQLGAVMILRYVKNADGTDYSKYHLRTSCVKRIEESEDKKVVKIETINSLFEFEKV